MRKLKQFAIKRKVLLVRSLAIMISLLAAVVLLSQTAFAKNTYVITDGNRTFTYSTFATDPAEVLGEAGLTLDENDTYTVSGLSSITVQRSQDITLEYYGEIIHTTSYGETVDQLLERLNISLGENDVINQPLDAATYDGMTLRIQQVLHLEQTYTTTLAHETTYCYDPSLPAGTETVLTEGVDGEALCTATVTYVDGEEVSRETHTETVTAAPVTEVIALGTNEGGEMDPDAMPIIGDGVIILPTGEVLTYTGTMQVGATAYECEGYVGTTATGTRARVGAIAVDPEVIPYGTRMFIVSNDGLYVYGIATAEDCGHPDYIHDNRVDLFFDTEYECIQFGFRQCTVYFLGTEETE